MAERRQQASRDEVNAAIADIREYHSQGRASLRDLPERGRYGQKAIIEAAEQLGWKDTKLRKARQFALMFTQKQLDDLCGLVRRHLAHFGTTHVGIAVTVPDARERAELLRSCIVNDWGKAQFQAEIKARLGPRRHGGRRRQVAEDPLHALVQVDEMADTWLRWHTIAVARPERNGHARSTLDRLPEPVQRGVQSVTQVMRRLRVAVTAGLEEVRSRRRRRKP
jgi:hypothetical protein